MVIVTDLGRFRSFKGLLKYMEENRVKDVYVDYLRSGGYAPDYMVRDWKSVDDIKELSEVKARK